VVDSHAELVLAAGLAPSTNIAEVMINHSDPTHWRSSSPHDSHLLIAPVQTEAGTPGNTGWWKIDRASGTTLGMTANGWGGTQIAELGFKNAETTGRTMKFAAKMLGIIVCTFGIFLKVLKFKRSHTRYDQAVEDAEFGGVVGIAACLVGGMTSGLGGIIQGPVGQVMGGLAELFGLGAASATFLYLLHEYLGGVNFSSRR
jgi:hypothetical protein